MDRSGETSRSQQGFREHMDTSDDSNFDGFINDHFDFNTSPDDGHNAEEHALQSRRSPNPQNGGEFFPRQAQNGFFGGPTDEGLNLAWSRANGHGDYDDGAEVRQLLSNPSFSIDDPADMQMADPTPDTVNDLFGLDYTPQEKEIVDKIKSSLPPPPQHSDVSPDNPLNLRPEFAASSASNPRLEQDIRNLSRTLASGEESYMSFDDAQQQHWLAEWDDVLNGYTDEVWGDMLPVVKAARSQLQEVKTGMDRLDSKAVARLRMILGHVVDTEQMSSTASSVAQTQSGAQQQVSASGMHQYIRTDGQSYAVQQPPGQPPVHEERHVQRKEEQKSEEDSDLEAPTFHCPYVSCHEQFHNEFELQMHSKQHKGSACPHFDCADRFEDSKEWAEHINRSHHGLLEERPGDEETGV
ncbi:hypothetical protein SLS56_000925 [Neofusicoccum ribis]|uniref:C2H2-type domain-containing protein n=1 Tax=Neofusicoccum ribis TaxID=45134 RepID=A0ABR3TB98_9PEZI